MPPRSNTCFSDGQSHRSHGRHSEPALVVGAARGRPQVTIVPAVDGVPRAHRSVDRSQAAHARHLRFNLVRRLAKVSTAAAALLRHRFATRRIEFHWPNRVQKPTNTRVDRTNPRMRLTATPALKA